MVAAANVTPVVTDDYAASTSTTGTVSVGGTRSANIETAGDADWFSVTLTAGQTYQFDVKGVDSGNGTLADPYMRLRDSAGTSLAVDDDSGPGLDARITYAPTTTGTYFVSAGSATGSGVGTYRVSATDITAFTITPAAPSVPESAGSIVFTVNRLGALVAETLYVSTWQGEGHANVADYLPKLNEALSFAAGQAAATVTVAIINDAAAEVDETFALLLQRLPTDPGGVYLAKASFTIVDDDRSATTYAISPAAGAVGEGAGGLALTVTRRGALPAQTLYLSTLQSEGFLNRGDYVGRFNETLVFAQGEVSKPLTIAILDDVLAEADETFGLLLQRHASDPGSVSLARTTFTIVDNDLQTVDDFAASVATTGSATLGQARQGTIDWFGDTDWFRVDLFAGVTYQFDARGQSSGSGSLLDPFLRLRDSAGGPIANAFADGGASASTPACATRRTSMALSTSRWAADTRSTAPEPTRSTSGYRR